MRMSTLCDSQKRDMRLRLVAPGRTSGGGGTRGPACGRPRARRAGRCVPPAPSPAPCTCGAPVNVCHLPYLLRPSCERMSLAVRVPGASRRPSGVALPRQLSGGAALPAAPRRQPDASARRRVAMSVSASFVDGIADARIKVIGCGGGGGNAVNRMITAGLQARALHCSHRVRVQLALTCCARSRPHRASSSGR